MFKPETHKTHNVKPETHKITEGVNIDLLYIVICIVEAKFKDRTDSSVMTLGYLEEGNPAELIEVYSLEKEGK